MKLKTTRTMPRHGQFIAVYSYRDRIYSHTLYMGKCGLLKRIIDSDYDTEVVDRNFYKEALFIRGV